MVKQQRRLSACLPAVRIGSGQITLTATDRSFRNCDSSNLYACMPACGWLQRVRHNTYTVCYRVLVADHHLLVDHPSLRVAHLIRTVILHNCCGPGNMKTSRSSAGGAFPSYDDFSEDDKRSNGINSVIAKYFAPTGPLALLILQSVVAPTTPGGVATPHSDTTTAAPATPSTASTPATARTSVGSAASSADR
jgi:hypothetical protein